MCFITHKTYLHYFRPKSLIHIDIFFYNFHFILNLNSSFAILHIQNSSFTKTVVISLNFVFKMLKDETKLLYVNL